MKYLVTGSEPNLIAAGFLDNTASIAVTLTTQSPTQLVYSNTFRGTTTIMTGTDLAVDGEGLPSGTVSEIRFSDNGTLFGSITDISWDLATAFAALQAIESDFDFVPLATLFDSSGPLTIDASQATDALNLEATFLDILPVMTSGLRYIDGDFSALKIGSSGDDTFEIDGTSERSTYHRIEATDGDDTIDLRGANAGVYLDLDYDQFYRDVPLSVTVDIDIPNNDGTVSTSAFTDTILGLAEVTQVAEGLTVRGSELGDTFNVDMGDQSRLELIPGEGSDQFDLSVGTGSVLRLDFSIGATIDPTSGLDLDLADGVINDDGFGNTENLNIVNNGGVVEVTTTLENDTLLGSVQDDFFRPATGSDSINGSGGFDTVDYSPSVHTVANVDLSAQTAEVDNEMDATDTDTLISIERIIGTRSGNDSILGTNEAEHFEGVGGDDTLVGRGGNDTLNGDDGADNLSGGQGDDSMNGGADDDLLRGNAGSDTLIGGGGADQLRGQRNADALEGGAGDDNLKGGGGNDFLSGGDGNDFLNGGTRADSILGGTGNDKLIGRSFNDTLLGGAGDDILNSGGDDDRLQGGSGNDFVKGGEGADIFVFDVGFELDRVADFTLADDRLEITAALADGRTAAEIADLAMEVGGNTELDFGNGDILRLQGVTDLPDLETVIVIV